jgi:hypothetical protein
MRKAISVGTALALLCLALSGYARDSVDGNRVVVTPYKDGTFMTGEYRFGKAELFGYIGDLKDTKKVTGILLRDGNKATAEQKHLIAQIAKAQELDAVIELDGKQQPLVDPTPAAEAGGAAAAGGS